jgi:hypothetical protein
MKTLIGAAIVAGSLALAGLGAVQPAAAAPKAGVQPIDASKATDLSARRRHHYGYDRYHEPYYLARPTYYRPYPYYYRPYPYYAAAPSRSAWASVPAFGRGGIGDSGRALGGLQKSLCEQHDGLRARFAVF